MNQEQQLIWDYLNTNARGYANKKSSSEIRDNCNLQAGDATNVYVRNLITDMILQSSLLYWKFDVGQRILDNTK